MTKTSFYFIPPGSTGDSDEDVSNEEDEDDETLTLTITNAHAQSNGNASIEIAMDTSSVPNVPSSGNVIPMGDVQDDGDDTDNDELD